MIILGAIEKGLASLRRSLRLVTLLWLAALITALPLAVAMEEAIRTDIGSSLVQRDLADGFDLGWLEEFHARSGQIARVFTPGRVSRAMPLENLELWLSGEWLSEHRQLAATGLVFLLVWILLQGGVLTHLSRRGRKFDLKVFLGEGGAYFFRFARIAGIVGLAYFALYRLAYRLFPAIERWTRDVTVERTALLWNLLAAVGLVLALSLVHLVSDFAKIATLRGNRRSMVLAVLHALLAVLRHPWQAFGTLAVLSLVLVIAQGIYILAVPGSEGSSIGTLVFTFLLGQLYLWFRWALRITRFGAEIALYDRWSKR